MRTLKEATKIAHLETEAIAYGRTIQSGDLTLEAYKSLISSNLFIHSQLEKSLETFFSSEQSAGLSQFYQPKTPWLEKDRVTLGIVPRNLPILAPTYKTIPETIGGLYVIEGSGLGGQMINRMLRKNKALEAIPTFYFFQGHGRDTGHRWRTFCQLVPELVTLEEEVNSAVQAANATFRFFQKVYQINQVS